MISVLATTALAFFLGAQAPGPSTRLASAYGLPPGVVVIESRAVPRQRGAQRAIVVWLLEPRKYPLGYGSDEYTCPAFGGINLEDISAPRCFQIEDRLKEELNIPVFHDDQHGTAVVVLAALINALKIVDKKMSDLKVVVNGVGAAGVACSKIILAAGVKNVIGCDQLGAIYEGRREHMNWVKDWYARNTNPNKKQGTIHDVMKGADVFLGLSVPGVIKVDDLKRMADKPIVFAMANPTPEIMPEEGEPHVAVMATGRSDYPNQINNVLCFPGIFKGALACRASRINEAMKLAAAHAIAGIITDDELNPEYIVPSVFDKRVAEGVAREVEDAAYVSGVARRERSPFSEARTEMP